MDGNGKGDEEMIVNGKIGGKEKEGGKGIGRGNGMRGEWKE